MHILTILKNTVKNKKKVITTAGLCHSVQIVVQLIQCIIDTCDTGPTYWMLFVSIYVSMDVQMSKKASKWSIKSGDPVTLAQKLWQKGGEKKDEKNG